MAQLFEVREGLEPIAARLAAPRIDPAEVDDLLEIFRGFDENPTPSAVRQYLRADRHFHWRLVELAANPHLAAAMESVNMMISAYQVGIPRSLSESLPEHRAILEALRRKDPDASEQAMRVHIRRSREKLKKNAEVRGSRREGGSRKGGTLPHGKPLDPVPLTRDHFLSGALPKGDAFRTRPVPGRNATHRPH